MPTLSDANFEAAYKHFLTVQAEWMDMLNANLLFSDHDTRGRPFRQIGFTNNPSELAKAQHLVAEWQRFADLAAERRRLKMPIGILKEIYHPVPMIIGANAHTRITRRPNHSSRDYPRESLIALYDTLLGKLSRVSTNPKLLDPIKKEREYFENQPPASKFRKRAYGYSEVNVELTPDTGGDITRVRQGAHGAILFNEHMQASNISVREMEVDTYTTFFDRLSPIPCALFENSELFNLEEVEQERQFRHAERRVASHASATRAVAAQRSRDARNRYRNNPKKKKELIERHNAIRPIRKWIFNQDQVLLERMRETGETEFKGVGYMRARFLTDAEIATGYYTAAVVAKRNKLIEEGETLYQDMPQAQEKASTDPIK